MNCEVIAVGTELLLGQIVDTNSSWLGEQLAGHGINCFHQSKVGDNAERIAGAFRQAIDRSDAVVVCGGLGPTHDDITRDVLAEVMGVPLGFDEAIAERIRAMFASRGRTMPENNLRQAMVPAGCRVMEQMPGTAPGLIAEVERPGGGSVVFYLVPGVPREMMAMVSGTVLGDLRRRAGHSDVIASRVLRTWGESESGLAERLEARIDELDRSGHATLALLASGVEGIRVRITARGPDADAVQAVIDDEAERLSALLGSLVFSDDNESMEEVVLRLLAERGLTLAVAEVGTGGYVSSRLSAAAARPAAAQLGASQPAAAQPAVSQPASVFAGATVHEPTAADVLAERSATSFAEQARSDFGASVGLALRLGLPESSVRPVEVAVAGLTSAGDTDATVTFRVPDALEGGRQLATISALNHLRLLLSDHPTTHR